MNTSRRTFLRNSGLAVAGTALFSEQLSAAVSRKPKDILGIQLYTVRDDMQKDPAGTLKQLSGIGYQYVEHANYVDRKFYGYSAAEFKKLLDGLELKMHSGHTVMGSDAWDAAQHDFSDKWKQTVDDAAVVGQHYVISPWMDEKLRTDADGLKRFLEVFNKCGELCKKSGMKFGYHNHDFEFNTTLNGKRLYDIILQDTDPALVAQQLDIGNMYGVGGRAMNILKEYPGRFELMHVKDEIKSTGKGEMGDGYESIVLGKGIMPVKEIIDTARKSGGTTYFIIEQESYQDKTPVECSKEDYMTMKKWGF